jgi:chromosome segregation ATPase
VSENRNFTQFPRPFNEKLFSSLQDIEVLKKKKLKIETELASDEKNKETIANQIRLLTEKLEEIDHRQQAKRNALAKIDDTLTQSEIGRLNQLNSLNLPISGFIFQDTLR